LYTAVPVYDIVSTD